MESVSLATSLRSGTTWPGRRASGDATPSCARTMPLIREVMEVMDISENQSQPARQRRPASRSTLQGVPLKSVARRGGLDVLDQCGPHAVRRRLGSQVRCCSALTLSCSARPRAGDGGARHLFGTRRWRSIVPSGSWILGRSIHTLDLEGHVHAETVFREPSFRAPGHACCERI